jgi:hypothetical protein
MPAPALTELSAPVPDDANVRDLPDGRLLLEDVIRTVTGPGRSGTSPRLLVPRRHVLHVVLALGFVSSGFVGAPTVAMSAGGQAQAVCGPVASGQARCLAELLPVDGTPAIVGGAPLGYGPSALQSAYNLPSSSQGAGQTVAIVDAKDDPNAEADLAVYRSPFGLPPCTTANGCFKKVDQNGGNKLPGQDIFWSLEISLDLDMASAICPNCHILLVEASGSNLSDLGTAENTAAALGANAISNSFGNTEFSNETSYDADFNHPGIAITAGSGDKGYGFFYPSASPYVTSVGGTSLLPSSNQRGWTETAWSGGGSGCSKYEPKPTWQTDSGCATRTSVDVAAVADPNTGVAVYDSYKTSSSWKVFGGTSVGTPIIAAIYAMAGNASSLTGAQSTYAKHASLFDVTSGSNGNCDVTYLCTAGPGYDGPTGNGTPNGISSF